MIPRDIKCAQWHPSKALIASCSKDSTVRLWDPRTHESVSTLYGHKSQVFKVRPLFFLLYGRRSLSCLCVLIVHIHIHTLFFTRPSVQVAFNPNGRWLLSGGQDALIKVWDLRMLAREAATLRGHRCVACVRACVDGAACFGSRSVEGWRGG